MFTNRREKLVIKKHAKLFTEPHENQGKTDAGIDIECR